MSSNDDDNSKELDANKPTGQSIGQEAKPEEIAKALDSSITNPLPGLNVEAASTVTEEVKPLPKRKTLSIIIHDASVLRAAYMQFIKGGGLFIPTKKAFKMGEDTNLVIRLLDEEDPYRVSGKVVWITPAGTTSNKAAGIGVEFAEDRNGERLRSRIEIILGPHLKSQESTHTM
jgi:type IV pilus assembly protein PilZ